VAATPTEEETPESEREPYAARPPRWVGFVTSLGLGLTVVVAAQTLAAIAEGFALKKTDPQGVPGDVFHRLGFALSRLDAGTLLFLVVAVVLVSLPVFLGRPTTDRQESTAAITLGLTVVMAVVIGIGGILAVRYNLHLYSASKRSVPSYVRIQLVLYLLGVLGTGAIALFGALTAFGLRDRDDREPDSAIADAS
jgi:hypothetical protein